MKIEFKSSSKNSEAVSMFVNGILYNKEIPYSEKHLLDCRGLAVYIYCAMTGNNVHDLEFEDSETKRLILCGYDYMNNPKYIINAINEGRIRK